MNFETAALQVFPELESSDTISRKQIKIIQEKTGASWPSHIANTPNTISRGLYKFSPRFSIESGTEIPVTSVIEETDTELYARLRDTYKTLDKLVEAVSNNTVNSLIVAGAPGLGKSYEVNKVLNEINSGEYGYVFHRGYLRATHLFRLLWENRFQGQTVVIDDCDAIFSDETALNILKAALELKETRMIGWGSEKVFVDSDNEEIPRYFDFQGNVIFLTNLNFSDLSTGNSKHAPHLAALESRSLVLDLKIRSKREIMGKIKLTVNDGMLRSKGLTQHEENDLVSFMENNIDKMKEISLRSIEKLTALYLMDKSNWKTLARTVMLK